MACSITAALSVADTCLDSIGGLDRIFIYVPGTNNSYDDVTFTTAADGSVTAIAGTAGDVMYEWNLSREKGGFSEAYTTSIENGTSFLTQTLTFGLLGVSQERQNQIKLLSTMAEVRGIIQTNDGKFYFFGKDKIGGLTLTSGTTQWGTAFGDLVGYDTFTLEGLQNNPAPIVDVAGGTIDSILTDITITRA